MFAVGNALIVRIPRRGEAEEALRREAELLAAIQARLPSAVPKIMYLSKGSPVCVVSRRLEGAPATSQTTTGRDLGLFLKALHELPPESVPLPHADVSAWRVAHDERRAQFEEHVFPLLSAVERERAYALFTTVEFDFHPTVVHGDLGPEHVLCRGDGHIAGVIDWADARIGDPAIDLAWALHGTNDSFAEAMADAYGGVSTSVRARATFYHRRGPWYEVLHGLEVGRPQLVTSGLAGVRARL